MAGFVYRSPGGVVAFVNLPGRTGAVVRPVPRWGFASRSAPFPRVRLRYACHDTRRRRQVLAATELLPRDKVLKTLQTVQVAEEVAVRLVDLAIKATKNYQVVATDFFLRPNELHGMKQALESLAFVGVTSSGGYAAAERQIAAFYPKDFAPTPEQEQQVATTHCESQLLALELAGNFIFDRASHSDFLGALIGCSGLRRERFGDIIILGDRGAQVVVLKNDAETIRSSVKMVRSVTVRTRQLGSLAELEVQPPRTKMLTSVEASLRLDAVGSAGFGMSRTKMVEMIKNGDVHVNWVPVKSASRNVAEGDTITARGRGRLQVISIAITSRGRFRVELKRYI
jgi:photosystem II S4 domain protein